MEESESARDKPSLQRRYAPESVCFGCGPANPRGLHFESRPAEDGKGGVVCDWTPSPDHCAYPGVLSSGIISTLLDCNCNWAAALHVMKLRGLESPPPTVSVEYSVRLHATVPNQALRIRARVLEATERRATVEGVLEVNGTTCATCKGTFVVAKEGHPAFHRW